MADTVQVGDIGTKIILDCVEDISTATVQKIKYKKPDGSTSGEWTAVRDGNTIYYITTSNDIDQAGCWKLQSYVELSGGWKGHGEVASLMVEKNA